MNRTKEKQGFTIIEVVLVLAIAGLIMLMVFVALPALQRGQRDTQRREDMSRLITAMQNYSSLHSGRTWVVTSGDGGDFFSNYLTANGDTFVDPSGDDYYIAAVTDCGTSDACPESAVTDTSDTSSDSAKFKSGAIFAFQNATCSQDEPVYKNSSGSYAFTIKLEGAGTICVNN